MMEDEKKEDLELEEGEIAEDSDDDDASANEAENNDASASAAATDASLEASVNQQDDGHGPHNIRHDGHQQHPPHHQQHQQNYPMHPHDGGPMAGMYPRGGPGGVGPVHKVNVRCRFYSKNGNKCTWGDHCRFEHRDDSPGPEFDSRGPPPGQAGMGLGPGRGPPGPPPPPMGGPAERGPYPPPYGAARHQPYPPPQPPHVYPYDAYGHHHHHHSTPPPSLPPHSMPHWSRQQHSSYPAPSPTHSPGMGPNPGPPGNMVGGSGTGGGPPPPGGPSSPGYPSPSSSAVVYERKHRLAYELAPWNDRGYPPAALSGRYDRGDPTAGYPAPGGRNFHRNHYSREPPYGREPMHHHMGGPYPGYHNYPSAYRAGPMGPHASHQSYKYMSSSQRNVPPDARSRSNKRGHDEDESSWSDSGSEDSILGQANYSSSSNKNHSTKASKHQHHNHHQPSSALTNPSTNNNNNNNSNNNNNNNDSNSTPGGPLDEGSGTPPGEPLPEDRERQEMLLSKLKEIEDLMAKKKCEQEDSL